MPNLKDIRRRIKSVQSTQKITQAMRMVAAAKVKKAENRVKAGRPYAEALQNVFKFVYTGMQTQFSELEGSRYLNLLIDRPVKRVGVVVLSSDRGLCGAYNTNIIRQTMLLERRMKDAGLEPKFYLVGTKVYQAFKRYGESTVLGQSLGISAAPTIHDANNIAEQLTQAFLKNEIDSIYLVYTRFKSMISYKVTQTELLPVGKQILEAISSETVSAGAQVDVDAVEISREHLQPEALLEPNPVAVLDALVPMYLSHTLYSAMLESSASELAARMTAMSNATKNAKEMIGNLTVLYNKARQASITQEILEVVSGAQALQ